MTEAGADRLAGWAANLRLEAVPPAVVEHTLRVVRDLVGSLLAGACQPENAALARSAAALGGTDGPSTVVGQPVGTSAPVAALINATAGVTLEIEEGNQFATNHPAVHVLPAALAVAEEQRASGHALVEAFLAGYEVATRAGRATRLRGPVHPFGTAMVLGAAAAASRLRGLDPGRMAQAFRIAAGTAVASAQSAANRGASVRNLCTGLTSHHGVLAATFAAAGFTGEPDAATSVFGEILGESFDELSLVSDLDEYFITRNYFKLHACSRWNHAPIEATAALIEEEPIDVATVERIVVSTFDPATRLAGREPANGYAAKHSIPYSVAVRIVHGTNGLAAYTDEAVADPAVRGLAAQVEVREDAAMTAQAPAVRAARVDVSLADGRVRTHTVDRAAGGYDNPYDDATLLAKFRTLAGMALPAGKVEELASRIAELPGMPSVVGLSRLLRSARLPPG